MTRPEHASRNESRLRSVSCVIALLLLSLSASAQVREKMTVELVEIPVHVNRADGTPVTDLTKDDFRLFVNGEPQAIEYFDIVPYGSAKPAIGSAAPPPATAAAAPLTRRRMFLLVFDVLNSRPDKLVQAQVAARTFITQDTNAADLFAVAKIGTDMQFIVPFTSDRIAVARAVTTLQASGAKDELRLATTAQERAAFGKGSAASSATAELEPTDHHAEGENLLGEMTLRDWASRESALKNDAVLRALGAAADALRSVEGEKHLVLLSQGLALPRTTSEGSFEQRILKMHNRFKTAGVFLDAVNISQVDPGIEAATRVPTSFDPVTAAGSETVRMLASPIATLESESLPTLALGTGGQAVPIRANITEALRSVADGASVSYVLAFHARNVKPENSVRVELTRKITLAQVRYRTMFSSGSGEGRNKGLALADALLNDSVQRNIAVALEVAAKAGKANLVAHVTREDILAYDAGRGSTGNIYFYIFRRGESVVAASASGQSKLNFAAIDADTIDYRREFPLSPGKYTAKMLYVLGDGMATGLDRVDFEVAP